MESLVDKLILLQSIYGDLITCHCFETLNNWKLHNCLKKKNLNIFPTNVCPFRVLTLHEVRDHDPLRLWLVTNTPPRDWNIAVAQDVTQIKTTS